MKKAERSFNWDTLSSRLRYLMRELGVKQKEFAEVCGVSDNYISMLVTGRRDSISEPLCRLICQTYGISDIWLKEGIGDPFFDREAETAARLRQQITDKMDALNSVQLQKLLELTETK